jgi:hypothetical protein
MNHNKRRSLMCFTMKSIGATVVLLALALPTWAEPQDPAELFPADTLAYLELRQPERLAQELGVLFKGSALEDMPAFLARLRERMPEDTNTWHFSSANAFALMLSPEMLADLGKMKGAAVAITGWDKEGPQFVAVVLAGDSFWPTYTLRAYLSVGKEFRVSEEVEGIPLYQAVSHADGPTNRPPGPGLPPPGGFPGQGGPPGKPGPGAPPLPPGPGPRRAAEATGLAYALLPRAVVIGSTPGSVGQVIRRLKGKAEEPALSGTAQFKDAAKDRDHSGLFAYANVTLLNDLLGADASAKLILDRWEPLLNRSSIQYAVASLALEKGDLALKARVALDPHQTCPLAQLISRGKTDLEWLHSVPPDALLAVSMAFPEGETRLARLWTLSDSISEPLEKGSFEDRVKEHLKQLRDKVGKGTLDKIANVGLAVLPLASEEELILPVVVVVTAADADGAKTLEERAVPRLHALLLGGKPASIRQGKIAGQNLRILTSESMPEVYFGRQGTTVVIGQDGPSVAAALSAVGKNGGLLGEEKTAVVLRDLGEPPAVGIGSLGLLLIEKSKAEPEPLAPNFPPGPGPRPPGARPVSPGGPPPLGGPGLPPGPKPFGPRQENAPNAELVKAVKVLPPATLTLQAKSDGIELRAQQTGLKSAAARIVDMLFEMDIRKAAEKPSFDLFEPPVRSIEPGPDTIKPPEIRPGPPPFEKKSDPPKKPPMQ